LTFEGQVMALDAQGNDLPLVAANFSDVLLGGGKKQVTVLYDLPPNVTNPSDAPKAAKLVVQFSHIQRKPKGTRTPDDNPFSQGAWIQIVGKDDQGSDLPQLEWKVPSDPIPVATRAFPTKPVMNTTEVLMSWMDPESRKINMPGPITASTAELL